MTHQIRLKLYQGRPLAANALGSTVLTSPLASVLTRGSVLRYEVATRNSVLTIRDSQDISTRTWWVSDQLAALSAKTDSLSQTGVFGLFS